MKEWLLLDCNYLCHRAKWAFRNLSYDSSLTGVVYGFLQTIPYLQERFFTPNIVFCWDSRTSVRRNIFPNYKQHRRHQSKTPTELKFEEQFRNQMKRLRREYLPRIGFRNVFVQKGRESDDLIGMFCHHVPSNVHRIIIVSSDQDLFQLLCQRVRMYDPQKQILITAESFTEEWGIHPSVWAEAKSIAGCPTDDVPGVEGVGIKTAIKYLTGKLDPKSRTYQSIQKSASLVERNRQLIYLPFEGTKKRKLRSDHLSLEGWRSVIEELGMKSLRGRVPVGLERKRKGRVC